jgi:hypothetical protein
MMRRIFILPQPIYPEVVHLISVMTRNSTLPFFTTIFFLAGFFVIRPFPLPSLLFSCLNGI